MTRCMPEFPNVVEGRFRVCVYHTNINYTQTHRWLTIFVNTCKGWEVYNNDNKLKYSLSSQLIGLNSSRKTINYTGDSQTVRRGVGYFNLFFFNFLSFFLSFNLCVLFFQTATKLLGQIVIKLLGLNYLTLILRRSRTGTVWFYTSTSNKRAVRPKLYTKSFTRDLKLMYSRLTLVRISINL